MRELTEEETQSISGGTMEGAPQVTSISQGLFGPAFVVHHGASDLIQPVFESDIRNAIDSMIMES